MVILLQKSRKRGWNDASLVSAVSQYFGKTIISGRENKLIARHKQIRGWRSAQGERMDSCFALAALLEIGSYTCPSLIFTYGLSRSYKGKTKKYNREANAPQ